VNGQGRKGGTPAPHVVTYMPNFIETEETMWTDGHKDGRRHL